MVYCRVEQNKNPIGIGPYSLLQPYYLISNLVKYRNAMAYWLVKSEPFKYSWEQFVADKVTYWDGVRNYAARNNLRAMKKGDRVLFYHSNEGLEIVGIAKVVKEYYQDPTTNDAAWSVVDLKAEKKLKNPVSLQKIKLEKRLANMQIIKLSRLSVTAVTEEEWFTILEMSETK